MKKLSKLKNPLLLIVGLLLMSFPCSAEAQSYDKSIEQRENQLLQKYYKLPTPPKQTPVVKPKYSPQPKVTVRPQPNISKPNNTQTIARKPRNVSRTTTKVPPTIPSNTYNLYFNRSPVVGNGFHLEGLYAEARLGFSRPQKWKVQSVKALIRYQHSPALLSSRSNLTVRVNGKSVGSIPLNKKSSEIGNAVFNIPVNLIQDSNEISLIAQQHNNTNCEDENPGDRTLWTEILPDSQLIFQFQPQPIRLDFSRYPYPFFDNLSLETNQFAYLLPQTLNDSWLSAAARYNAHLGRLAEFRPLDVRTIKRLKDVQSNERLAIFGTPEEQPALKNLELPIKIANNQLLDGNNNPLPNDVGVLMVAKTADDSSPVLVATGNGPEGVLKAVQFLVQPRDRKLGTGQLIFVDTLNSIPTPPTREWPDYLPQKNKFQLGELKLANDEPFKDVTLRGAGSPPIELDFRALPDDWFKRGSHMNLVYSYGPQANPRTSSVEVLLDNVFIGGARLTNKSGETRKTLKVDLPHNLIKPNSKLQIAFRLNPIEQGTCGIITDQQLSGTLHSDTSFNLNREVSVDLPDLKLLQFGFPFAAPQDLSSTAIVLPDSPSVREVMTLLEFAQRLGRLSKSDSIQLEVHTAVTLPPDTEKEKNLVGIGIRDRFPFPEVFDSNGFVLNDFFSRQEKQTNIQTLVDEQGAIKQIVSPSNKERVLLALTAQTENGLERVQQLLKFDPWFFQLQGDTALISSNFKDISPYDNEAYQLEFFKQAPVTRRIENATVLSKASRFVQEQWYVVPTGIVVVGLMLYGIVQVRLTSE